MDSKRRVHVMYTTKINHDNQTRGEVSRRLFCANEIEIIPFGILNDIISQGIEQYGQKRREEILRNPILTDEKQDYGFPDSGPIGIQRPPDQRRKRSKYLALPPFPFQHKQTVQQDFGVFMASTIIMFLLGYHERDGFIEMCNTLKSTELGKQTFIYNLIYCANDLHNKTPEDIEQHLLHLLQHHILNKKNYTSEDAFQNKHVYNLYTFFKTWTVDLPEPSHVLKHRILGFLKTRYFNCR